MGRGEQGGGGGAVDLKQQQGPHAHAGRSIENARKTKDCIQHNMGLD